MVEYYDSSEMLFVNPDCIDFRVLFKIRKSAQILLSKSQFLFFSLSFTENSDVNGRIKSLVNFYINDSTLRR